MNILLNGEPNQVDNNTSLSQLIESLDLGGKRLAIEVNNRIIPRSQHTTHLLSEGDKIEIVHAIGGGEC